MLKLIVLLLVLVTVILVCDADQQKKVIQHKPVAQHKASGRVRSGSHPIAPVVRKKVANSHAAQIRRSNRHALKTKPGAVVKPGLPTMAPHITSIAAPWAGGPSLWTTATTKAPCTATVDQDCIPGNLASGKQCCVVGFTCEKGAAAAGKAKSASPNRRAQNKFAAVAVPAPAKYTCVAVGGDDT